MTDLLLAIGATAASVTVMWVVCLRPMRRAHRTQPGSDTAAGAAAEVARLRREVARLRQQNGVR